MKPFLRPAVVSLLVVSSATMLVGALHPVALQKSADRHAVPQKAKPRLIAGKTLDAYIREPVGSKEQFFKEWAEKSGVKIGKVVIEPQSHDTARTKQDPGLADLQRRFRAGTTGGIAFYGAQPGLGNAPTSLWIKSPRGTGTELRSYCVLMERGEYGEEWWCVFDSIVVQCFFNGPVEYCHIISGSL